MTEEPGRAPYRWAILTGGSVAQAAFSAYFLGLPALAPALRDEYGLSLSETGVLLASVNVGVLATLLLWGVATDRAGERTVITTGLLGAAAALGTAAFVRPYAAVVLLLGAAGALGASVNSGTGRAVMTWFGAAERGLALGIRQTAIPIAGAGAAVTLPWLAGAHGIRAALLALSGGCVVGSLTSALVLRERPGKPADTLERMPSMLRDRALWRLSIGSVFVCVAQLTLVGFVVLFLHDARGLSPARAALALAASQLVAAVLRISFGVWSDRRRSRIAPLRGIALALGAILIAVSALLHARLVVLVPMMVLAAGLSMGWNSLSFAAAAEIGGTKRSGAAIGIQQTILASAAVLVPVVFAATVEATTWRLAFFGAAFFPLAGWWVLRPLAESNVARQS